MCTGCKAKVGFTMCGKLLTTAAVFIGCAALTLRGQVPHVYVDDDFTDATPGWGVDHFTSIQQALAVVAPSGMVEVATGSYVEGPQVVISNAVTIVGAGPDLTVIRPSASTGSSGDARGWWLVPSNTVFNLSDVTLDGDFPNRQNLYGVLTHGLTRIDRVHFTGMTYKFAAPATTGLNNHSYAVGALTATGSVLATTLDVSSCTFDNMGHGGVHYYGNASGIYSNNLYIGKGPGDWLDYGFQVSASATATVTHSEFRDCLGIRPDGPYESFAVFVTSRWGSGSTLLIDHCTITNNLWGIIAGSSSTDDSRLTAHFNDFSGNTQGGVASWGPSDASLNWWGSASGPAYAGNAGGQGVIVDDFVDYSPWLTDATDTQGLLGFQPLFFLAYTPHHLEFSQQPDGAVLGAPFSKPPVVRVIDEIGGVASQFVGSVTLAFADAPAGAYLGGTAARAVGQGVAAFPDLWVAAGTGSGFTLSAATALPVLSATSTVFAVTGDSDGDGLPDAWEILYFTRLTASDGSQDFDHDGFVDRDEYWAGTIPSDPASLLVFTAIIRTESNETVLKWQSVNGRKYGLKMSSDLMSANWPFIANDLAGVGPTNTFTHSGTNAPAFFGLTVRP